MLATFFLLSIPYFSLAQKLEYPIYRWEEILNASPDTIYGISFAKKRQTELPVELSKFINLRYLNLNKNKLQFLPEFISELKGLEVFQAEKNDFEIFPHALTDLPQLKIINLHQNKISAIPESIQNCSNLEELDLSDNDIEKLPDAVFELKTLKVIDLSNIRMGPRYQKELTSRRPDIKWILDPPCDCMD